MNNLKTLCFGFLIASVLVASVSAMECYFCSECNDPFDSTTHPTKVTCSGSCLKTKTNGHVARVCSSTNLGDECDTSGDVEACSCTGNLCNTASAKSFPLVGLCLSILTIFLWAN